MSEELLSPEMRNFIFSVLTEGIQATKINSKNPKLRNSGVLLSVSFISSRLNEPVKNIADVKLKQRYSFMGYAGDSLLGEEEKNKLQGMLPFNIVEEMQKCKHIFFLLDCKSKRIYETKELETGEQVKTVW